MAVAPDPSSHASRVSIPIIGLASVDSTNDEARRRLATGATQGPFAILAAEQTAGRGTRGRHWDSPAGGGLYLSLAMPGGVWPLAMPASRSEADTSSATPAAAAPPVELAHTLAAGVAAVEALADVFGIAVQLKPVNDLLVDGAKLGGILVETVVRGGRTEAMVVGVGINLRGDRRTVADGAPPAISVQQLLPAGRTPAPEDTARLAESLVARLAAWIARTVRDGSGPATAAWRRHAISGAVLPPGV